MTENLIIGHISNKRFDGFVWKIPNISSVPHEVDYFVQSPSFSWCDTPLILKMYPNGQTVFKSEGYIDVIIERQHCRIDQTISIHIFCVDIFDKKVGTEKRDYGFTSNRKQCKLLNFMQSLKDNPERWKITPNDTFTLVCAFKHPLSLIGERDFQALLNKHYYMVGSIKNLNSNETGIGELSREVYESFFFKICKIGPKLPLGYQIQQEFSFANAIWILKIYPYFAMENKKPSFDVVLERLQSKIFEHNFNLEIVFDNSIEQIGERFFMFNSHHKIGDVLSFRLKESAGTAKCLHTELIFRMKNSGGLKKPDLLMKSSKLNEVAGSQLGSRVHILPNTEILRDQSGSSMVFLQNTKVLSDFQKLFLQQEDSDVTIKVKGQEFPAHKAILKARSPVLASAFRSDMKEKVTGILNIEDCEPHVFEIFLCFLYCGDVQKLSVDNVFNLFVLGDKYDVPDLRNICMEFMKLNLRVDTFCDTIALALQHSDSELIKLSRNFFRENLQKIIVTVKWQSFLLQNPIPCNELLISALVTKSPESSSSLEDQMEKEKSLKRRRED